MSGLYRAIGRVVLGVATVSDRRRVHTLAATLTVAACVVSGCTDPASKPKPLPSPYASDSASASASASASPTDPAPTLPPAANGTSDAAAKAFARHYIDLVNYSARTGETTSLESLGSPSCRSCDAIASNVKRVYGSGGRIESSGWMVKRVILKPGTNPDEADP